MPSLEHRVAALSPMALARRQERARRLIHTLSTIEPGLIGLELKRERLVLTRRLHAAAEEGRDAELVALQTALTRNRDQMLRLAGWPMPGRSQGTPIRHAQASDSSRTFDAIEIPDVAEDATPDDPLDCPLAG